jgi:hypothetical protein
MRIAGTLFAMIIALAPMIAHSQPVHRAAGPVIHSSHPLLRLSGDPRHAAPARPQVDKKAARQHRLAEEAKVNALTSAQRRTHIRQRHACTKGGAGTLAVACAAR